MNDAIHFNTLNLTPEEREARLEDDVAFAVARNGARAAELVDAALSGGLPTDYRSQCAKLCQFWHLGVVLDSARSEARTPAARRTIQHQETRLKKADLELCEMLFGTATNPRLPLNIEEVGALVNVIEFDEREMLEEHYDSHFPGQRAQAALLRAMRKLAAETPAAASVEVLRPRKKAA